MSKPLSRSTALLTCLLSFLYSMTPAHSQGGDPQRIIAQLEQDYSDSFITGDTSVAQRLLSDDFLGFDPSGKTWDKATILADVKSDVRPLSLKITALTVKLYGDTAIALGTEEDNNSAEPRVTHRRWLDTWRSTPKGWRLVSSAEVEPKP